MISAFIGSPGSGKSTMLAWVARRATMRPNKPIFLCGQLICPGHSHVFTNFRFDGAFQLDYDSLGKCSFKDALILIDEMSMYSDSRDFARFSSDLLRFYTQHRHSNITILWTNQMVHATDRKIRDLTVNYFLVEPFFFGLNRVTHISAFTRLEKFEILSGYEYRMSQFINPRPIYKLFDSYADIGFSSDSLSPPPLLPWSSSSFSPSSSSSPPSSTSSFSSPSSSSSSIPPKFPILRQK